MVSRCTHALAGCKRVSQSATRWCLGTDCCNIADWRAAETQVGTVCFVLNIVCFTHLIAANMYIAFVLLIFVCLEVSKVRSTPASATRTFLSDARASEGEHAVHRICCRVLLAAPQAQLQLPVA